MARPGHDGAEPSAGTAKFRSRHRFSRVPARQNSRAAVGTRMMSLAASETGLSAHLARVNEWISKGKTMQPSCHETGFV